MNDDNIIFVIQQLLSNFKNSEMKLLMITELLKVLQLSKKQLTLSKKKWFHFFVGKPNNTEFKYYNGMGWYFLI